MKKFFLFLVSFLWMPVYAQPIAYPYPVKFITVPVENKRFTMAYMDVPADHPNGETVLLLHGKNFNGYYWKDVISFLTANGYRVIAPDQVGWGRSDKPDIHYSFHLLAANTKALLDSLCIQKVHVIGHSMGGMLATRFVLLFPAAVDKLIFENPIGLEDYRTFVPYQTVEKVFEKEAHATYDSYKKYQQGYYPVWKPAYEQYVAAQAEDLNSPHFQQTAWANALTYGMIYEQPVVYEFRYITRPTLIIIGQADRTIVGKDQLTKEVIALHGQYPALGRNLQQQIKGSKLIELQGVGHIPHIQAPEDFKKAVLHFLQH